MKIKIDDDLFGIADRIKEIDESYFILFDLEKNVYEIHNSNQESSYCLSLPFDMLDSRVIEIIQSTSIRYIDKIMEDIDNNNNKIDNENKNRIKSQSDYMLREIYEFCNNSSKKFDENSFQTDWR